MPIVYATSFAVRHLDGAPPAAAPDVIQAVRSWAQQSYERRGVPAEFPESIGPVLVRGDGVGEITACPVLKRGLTLWSLNFAYADPNDSTLQWDVACDVAASQNQTEFSIVLRLRSIEFNIKPIHYELGTPRVVRELVRAFACSLGSRSITDAPQDVVLADIEDFASLLTGEERQGAVVLLSREPFSGRPTVEPGDLAKRLVGLAEVFVIDRQAGFALTDRFGRSLSCYNGAVRIYYPGFSSSAAPYSHPLYLTTEIERRQNTGKNFGAFLLWKLASVAAARWVDRPLAQEARREFRQMELDEHSVVIARLVQQARREADNEAEELLDALSHEQDELRRKADELEDENARLRSENVALRENFALVYSAPRSTEDFEAAPAVQAVGTVLEALQLARKNFSEQLLFLDPATESAQESPYKQPERVYDLLEALAEVTSLWQAAREQNRGMGGSWKQMMEARGFDWADHVSQTSRTKWADDYYFQYKGERCLFEEHVTLGAGQPNTCLSVHVLRDEGQGKLVIGHVGRHLTNTSS